MLVSWTALRAGGLPRGVNYLGLVIGAAGILTVVPMLNMLGFVFGLGAIIWFIAVGIVLLRSSVNNASEESKTYFPHLGTTI